MTMKLPIQKWGNSAAVRLPAALLTQMKVAPGDKLAVELRAEGLLLTPTRRSYSLEELIAQCDPTAHAPDDLPEWNCTPPVGREKW